MLSPSEDPRSKRTRADGPTPRAVGVALGDVLDGRYRLVRPLGEGSMGHVFVAHDENLGRSVAIKLIRPDLVQDPVLRAQFLAEARSLARVRHPNVVQIHDLGQWAGAPYFVMELVEGENLEVWLARHPEGLAVDQALGILFQVAVGVGELHRMGVVHRDLKPGNVLIGARNRARVADLGLAEVVSATEGWRSWGGTPLYMAPELVLGLPVPRLLAPRVDMYALGIIAFELLTGEAPIQGVDVEAILRAQVELPVPCVSAVRPELEAFDHAIGSVLEKDPALRQGSVEVWLAELRRARASIKSSVPRSRRIVVVDDDADFSDLVVASLTDALDDAVIEHHLSATAARHSLGLGPPPDLVVLDLHMPGETGESLLAWLRAEWPGRGPRVLIVSGRAGHEDWARLEALGADAILLKPVQPGVLVANVRHLLGRN